MYRISDGTPTRLLVDFYKIINGKEANSLIPSPSHVMPRSARGITNLIEAAIVVDERKLKKKKTKHGHYRRNVRRSAKLREEDDYTVEGITYFGNATGSTYRFIPREREFSAVLIIYGAARNIFLTAATSASGTRGRKPPLGLDDVPGGRRAAGCAAAAVARYREHGGGYGWTGMNARAKRRRPRNLGNEDRRRVEAGRR